MQFARVDVSAVNNCFVKKMYLCECNDVINILLHATAVVTKKMNNYNEY